MQDFGLPLPVYGHDDVICIENVRGLKVMPLHWKY